MVRRVAENRTNSLKKIKTKKRKKNIKFIIKKKKQYHKIAN